MKKPRMGATILGEVFTSIHRGKLIMCALDDLIKLCELGWCVFPVFPNDKNPIPKHGYKEATNDLKQVKRWMRQHPGCNWGMVIPPEAFVVDIDLLDDGSPNPWPGQDESWDLMNTAGAITDTPSGGNHYYFRQPIPGRWGSENGWLPQVDTRTNMKGYVILPGSVARSKTTKELKPYLWVIGSELNCKPEELPLPPDWLIEALNQSFPAGKASSSGQRSSRTETPPECKIVADKGIITFVNTNPAFWEEALKLVERSGGVFLRTHDGTQYWQRPGKLGDDHSATWNNPGARDAKLGFPRFKVFTSNWPGLPGGIGENDPKPYSTWDLIKQLESPEDFDLFQGYARLEYNNHLAYLAAEEAAHKEWEQSANSPEDQKTEEPPTPKSNFQNCVLTAAELLDQDIQPPEEIIPGVVGAGEMVTLVSCAKAKKTFTCLDLAFAASQGKKWLTGEFLREMRVLYIDGEMSKSRLSERLKKILAERAGTHGYQDPRHDPEWLRFILLREIIHEVDVEILAKKHIDLIKDQKPDLVIADNLRAFFPHGEGWEKANEIDNATMKKILCLWGEIRAACDGAAMVLVHHSTKSHKEMYAKPVIEHGAGGGAFGSFPDGAMSLYQQPPAIGDGLGTGVPISQWDWILGGEPRNYPPFHIPLVKSLRGLLHDRKDWSTNFNDINPPAGGKTGGSNSTKTRLTDSADHFTHAWVRNVLSGQNLWTKAKIKDAFRGSKEAREQFLQELLDDGFIVEHDTPLKRGGTTYTQFKIADLNDAKGDEDQEDSGVSSSFQVP